MTLTHPHISIETVNIIAQQAGEAIMKIYSNPTCIEVDYKPDHSPLTIADKTSNEIITLELKKHFPALPIISEENKMIHFSERKKWKSFWLIDPLDGTKEFIKRNGEFTVNIALIENGIPVLGVVYVPIAKTLYFAQKAKGAFKRDEHSLTKLPDKAVHYTQKNELKVVASRSHLTHETNEFITHLKSLGKKIELVSLGSSLKICKVAEGQADVYPRFGPTMEWDTAAAHAIALESGRTISIYKSDLPLHYNKENLLNPYFLVS